MQSKTSWFNRRSASVKPGDGRDRLAAEAATAGDAQNPRNTAYSWVNGTLFKKNLARFWPVWGLYLAIWMFMLPVYLLSQMSRYGTGGYGGYESAQQYFSHRYVLDMASPGVWIAAIFGVLAAMAVFSYLYNNRSAGMFHALPVKREGLFLTNYLSGLFFLAGPAVVVFLCTLGAEAIVGAVDAGALCMWLVIHLLTVLFFYSFAVFCAMFTGNILAHPAFYGILNLLAYALYNIVEFILDRFLFGYWYMEWLQTVARWLTPVWSLSQALYVETIWDEMKNQVISVTFGGLTAALIYGFVGVVLAVLALLLYRKRHLESAGDVVSVSWVRPIFKYGVGVCAALTGGTLLYGWFGRTSNGDNFWSLFLFLIPCGAIGYFAAEMLLKKSFRAFEHWKGCIVMVCAVALCVVAVRIDVFGYGSRIPNLEEVKTVSLGGGRAAPYDDGFLGGSGVTDPEYIQAVLDLQAAIVADKARVQNWTGVYDTATAEVGDYQTSGSTTVSVDYELKSGSTVSRSYYLPIDVEHLADPASYDAQLQAMSRFPQVNLKNYYRLDSDEDTYKLVEAGVEVYNTATGEFETIELSAVEAEELRAAVVSDLTAGRLGQRYLLDDERRMNECYYNDLYFYFLNKGADTPANYDVRSESERMRVTVLITASDTIAALERLGVTDESHTLVTQQEIRRISEQTNDAEKSYLDSIDVKN